MKLQAIKKEIYYLTCTKNTKQLKKERSDLTTGKDLRYKKHWISILKQVESLRACGTDVSIEDLNKSERMLKESMFKVSIMAGLDMEQIEVDWQRIQLEAQFGDIHIEEL